MCLVFVCDQDERVIGRFCFVPLSNKSKRRHLCSTCGKRLIVHG
ncbi:methionyl-tRNA synthetase [Arabidopsis thaliana]|uniref:Methionyl-tRNA synthetase n=1 Tax=Arabidopsis thaliana TaxID=3702 RepID=F4KI93_ARATH|nr:methionyl-tRNA synthetase [Arabidopsis thaliana]AED91583.1 methionyl-tRNA synthetase [Arabidopsis thaliana]|eukprot:NP_001190284.1 methionyl-tRNA synthetase [Arabidopsis thaliana]